MAGSAPVEEAPKLGRGATIVAFLFVALILTGFGVTTAVSHEDQVAEIIEEKSHSDEDKAEDDHSEDGAAVEAGNDHE